MMTKTPTKNKDPWEPKNYEMRSENNKKFRDDFVNEGYGFFPIIPGYIIINRFILLLNEFNCLKHEIRIFNMN
jgi:hypothetical protein